MKLLRKYFKHRNNIPQKNDSIKERILRIIRSVSGVLLSLLIWFIIVKIIVSNPNFEQFHGFMPLPSFVAFLSLLSSKFFWISVIASLTRIIIGIIIASIIGIPVGLMIGFYKHLKELTNIPIQFIRMISPLAWMPIAVILFPSFEKAIIFLITITTVWPMIINTTQGVSNVNPDLIKMAQNQGANDYQVLFHVVFPSSVPYILTGFRLALGIAWIVLVPAEFLGISSGLGYLINDARDTMEYNKLMAVIIAIGFLGFILDGAFQVILKKVDWRKNN